HGIPDGSCLVSDRRLGACILCRAVLSPFKRRMTRTCPISGSSGWLHGVSARVRRWRRRRSSNHVVFILAQNSVDRSADPNEGHRDCAHFVLNSTSLQLIPAY